MSGCFTVTNAKFDHLVRVMATHSLHCKGMFSFLQLARNLMDET